MLSNSDQDNRLTAQAILDEIKAEFGMVPNFFKAQAEVDPAWLASNWQRHKEIMVKQGALDRKTKELIAMAVSIVNRCDYCSVAHEGSAMMAGATQTEVNETKKVIELFASFNAIAESLRVPLDSKAN